jgi:DNA mismatch repair ATPase MutL
MYLIDQHAAQERVNYERYLKYLKNEDINNLRNYISAEQNSRIQH